MTYDKMDKQQYWTSKVARANALRISTMSIEQPEGTVVQHGKDWDRHQVYHDKTFSMVMYEGYHASADDIGYTAHEDYVKINLWLSGRHSTILDGHGQHDHDRPEVFITSCPEEMIKVDVINRESRFAVVAVCLLRDFFPKHMGMALDELPQPLRGIFLPKDRTYTFCRFPLTPDLAAAARAILVAPLAVRRNTIYGQAKCMELMCLLINLMTTPSAPRRNSVATRERQAARLQLAREIIASRYAQALTLEQISKEVGLSRAALTSGFKQRFNMSVFDCLQKQRMERAYELLLNEGVSVAQAAEAVGYSHSCNFSTAFHHYFGHTPQAVRGGRL